MTNKGVKVSPFDMAMKQVDMATEKLRLDPGL